MQNLKNILILLILFSINITLFAAAGSDVNGKCPQVPTKSLERIFNSNTTITESAILKTSKSNPISVTYSDMLQLYQPQNNLLYYWTDEGIYQMDIGTVDYENSQTWIMSAFPLNVEPTGDGIPIENAPGRNHFPEATHCRLYNYTDNTDSEFFYEYYEFTENEITLLGFLDTIPTLEWSEHDNYDELVTPLPLDINTDFETQSEVEYVDTIYNRKQYVYTEGYGTLTTPYGTEEVLKVRADVLLTIYDLNYNIIDEYETIYITFYSKQGTRLVLELEEGSTATGTVNVVDVQFESIIQNPAFIENIETKVENFCYPNPATDILNFQEIGNYQIYNSIGVLVLNLKNVQNTDISNLKSGLYFVKSEKGKIQKLIINN